MNTQALRSIALVAALVAASFVWASGSKPKPSGPTKLLALGAKAPAFSLPNVVTGKKVSAADLADKKVLVYIQMCRHCPYVAHVIDGLVKFGNDYADKSVAIVGVSSNDAQRYKQDRPESLREFAQQHKLPFPLLYDESQAVAKAFTAVCTPEIFIFNAARALVYRGQFDASRPRSGKAVTGKDARAAVDAVLAGKPVSKEQDHAVGCNIKWKPDNRPPYAR